MARFYYFNVGGSNKWKYEGSGLMPALLMQPQAELRAEILEVNRGQWPGIRIGKPDPGYHVVIVPEDAEAHGYPIMLLSNLPPE